MMKMTTRGNHVSSLWRRSAVAAAVACVFASGLAHANGTDPTVVAGQASFSTQGSSLSITNSPGAIINWHGFSIGASEATNFIQQSAASSVLNRVIGSDPSVILGTLTSNGRVFLINPSGILVGQGARIDVAGLVASTLNLSNQDFLAGRLNFASNPSGGNVENQGSITTPSGGSVYLVGANVSNSGIINSPQGDVILAAGQSVNILDSSTPGVRVEITASNNAAVNLGEILAQSGEVGIYGAALRNTGIINADQVGRDASGKIVLRAKQDVTLEANSHLSANGERGGEITVQSETGDTLVSGTIEAQGTSAASGKGGTVQLLGNRVGLITASVDASGTTGGGAVLVGGDYQGKNPSVQNASATYVSPDSSVMADAITSGNGGKVIVWSDGSTLAYGSFTAPGGAQSGDGGLIETSGHTLDVTGVGINAGALHGNPGTWLLDPWNVTITTAAVASGAWRVPFPATTIWDTTASGSNVTNTTISGYLNAGTNVTITTTPFPTDAGTEPGNITVNAPILHDSNSAGSPNVTLTLTAGTTGIGQGNIVINDSISATTGSNVLNVVLNSAGGSVGFGPTGSVSTNGGNVTITAATSATLGNITTGATGVVTVTAGGALTLGGTISANGPGDAVVLAGNSFTNSVGAGAITTPGGRWLVYSSDPSADTFGSLSSGNLALWNKTYAGYPPASVIESGNRYLFANQPALTVTADANTKVYGDAAALTATVTGLVNAASYGGVFTQDAYSGAPTLTSSGSALTAGVSGSPYTVTTTSGSFAAPTGYGVTSYVDGTLAVTARPVTVTADAGQTKIYGNTDPLSFTYTNTSLGAGTPLVGALDRAAGENVSSYAIGQGTLTNASNSNYNLSYVGDTFAITPAPLNVVANPQSKLFGTSDPALTFSVTGLVNNPALGIADTAGTVLSGTLTRIPGESALAGPYAITQGSLAANSNYTLGFTQSNLIITGAAAEPVLGFNAGQVIFAGVINNEFYYRPGNFWHIALNPNNADPGFDVMRGTNDLNSRLKRSASPCDSVSGGGFCETWTFPQQREKVDKK